MTISLAQAALLGLLQGVTELLTKYFETKTLTPFALYCVAAGILSLLLLSF